MKRPLLGVRTQDPYTSNISYIVGLDASETLESVDNPSPETLRPVACAATMNTIKYDILIRLGHIKQNFLSNYIHSETNVITLNKASILDLDSRLLLLIGELYVSGTDFNWETIHPDGSGKIVHLPLYPFESRSHWIHELTDTPTGQELKESTL